MKNKTTLEVSAGTNQIQENLTIEQGRKLWLDIFNLCIEEGEDKDEFKEWLIDRATHCPTVSPKWYDHVQVVLGQLSTKLTKRTVYDPSPESLAWSSFEGGHIFFDKSPAQEWLNNWMSANVYGH